MLQSLPNLPYNILRCETHEEWLKARMEGIGSSEAGTLGGVNHFDTVQKLYLRKIGREVKEKETKFTAAGHKFEPVVAWMFAKETGAIIDPTSEGDWIAVSKTKPHLRVSPDRLFYAPGTPKEMQVYQNAHLLEIKTTSQPVDRNNPPLYWQFQVQYQMGVLGLKQAVIAWFSYADCLSFDYAVINFSQTFFDELVATIDDFWFNNVQKKVAPEYVANSDDALLKWGKANGMSVTADKKMEDLVIEYAEKNAAMKALCDRLDAIKLDVQCFMKDAEMLVDEDGTKLAVWNNVKTPARFDTKRFEAERPTLYQKYMGTPGTSRRFAFK